MDTAAKQQTPQTFSDKLYILLIRTPSHAGKQKCQTDKLQLMISFVTRMENYRPPADYITQPLMHFISEWLHSLTLVFASILDPLSSNNLTMLLLPLFDAT